MRVRVRARVRVRVRVRARVRVRVRMTPHSTPTCRLIEMHRRKKKKKKRDNLSDLCLLASPSQLYMIHEENFVEKTKRWPRVSNEKKT